MSSVQEVDVTIRPDGRVDIKVRGVAGKSCLAITKKVEQHLGGHIASREHTDEYHQVTDEASDELTVGK